MAQPPIHMIPYVTAVNVRSRLTVANVAAVDTTTRYMVEDATRELLPPRVDGSIMHAIETILNGPYASRFR